MNNANYVYNVYKMNEMDLSLDYADVQADKRAQLMSCELVDYS